MPSYTKKVQIPGKTAQELYDKVAKDIDRFLEKSGMGKFEIERDATRREVCLKSSLVNAKLICTDGNLVLDAKLSLLAAPFRGKIDEGIDKWLAKAFQLKA
ncbi:MAG: polyhydroxyalkanoic acid system family protein [Oligoflexia bacterium]|nr:polyhydroxyalkanoic acid system family protein [Oligoflexia bacterium]